VGASTASSSVIGRDVPTRDLFAAGIDWPCCSCWEGNYLAAAVAVAATAPEAPVVAAEELKETARDHLTFPIWEGCVLQLCGAKYHSFSDCLSR
jgi:hypothetical protein